MKRLPLYLILALIVATAAAFWGVGSCGFVGYDDPSYVSHNHMVNQGLRSAAIAWAFSATHGANWHPLTSLSHMLDCSLFDLNPEPMHWENLLLHLLNTVLVFCVWRRLGRFGEEGRDPIWQSAFVAGLFALHPAHVESVAWISERKDVLSTALWLLTFLAYARWVEAPTTRRYVVVAIGTLLGLMAKPMVATLPCTLLLLDFWPLRRWPAQRWPALFREKIPLFVIVAIFCVVTIFVQRALGATDYGEKFPLQMRVGNAFVSYARYLGKAFWPETLSPFYPHPGWWPWATVLGAFALFAAVSFLTWRERERRPWFIFGWCWYLGTLVPVIGITQVGAQSMADRYTYIPLLGIFTIVAWGGAEVIARWPVSRIPLGGLAAVVLVACGIRTANQVPVWRRPLSLIEHMRKSVGEHEIVYREFGMAYLLSGGTDKDVLGSYMRGHEVRPDYAYFINEIATFCVRTKQYDEARWRLLRVIELLPHDPAAYANYANFLITTGEYDEAMKQLRRSLDIRPSLSGAYRLMGDALMRQGKKADARDAIRQAVRYDRWDAGGWNQLGVLEADLGNLQAAEKAVARAMWINPRDRSVALNLQYLQKQLGKRP